MRRPGVEPGSKDWKSLILTTILPAHVNIINYSVLKITILGFYILKLSWQFENLGYSKRVLHGMK